MVKKLPDHLPWLDGIRGVAALWVVLHHIHILIGAPYVPILSWGELAVDLFIMVSGFLMTHHYLLRRDRHPWGVSSTWVDFWARRWFRLSPLYYLLLTVALAMGPTIGGFRSEIAQVWPATATAPERYQDATLLNFAMHLSYLFGVLPDYSFRTPLPDWSIGLEAQFYLAFPFIMLLMARAGPIKTGLLISGICLGLQFVLPSFMKSFPLPSFLPLKMYVFLIGIWAAFSQQSAQRWDHLAAAIGLACVYLLASKSMEAVGRVALILIFFYLVNQGRFYQALTRPLSGRIGRFMGDTSYALYLLHLLIVIPIAALLSRHPTFNELHWTYRLLLSSVLVLPLAYLASIALFRFIEQPGITLGKRALKRST